MSEKFKAQVIADGRITISLTLRKLMSIESGDFVELQLLRKIVVVEKEVA